MTSSDGRDDKTAVRYGEFSGPVFAPEVLDPTVDFLAASRRRRVDRPGHRPGASSASGFATTARSRHPPHGHLHPPRAGRQRHHRPEGRRVHPGRAARRRRVLRPAVAPAAENAANVTVEVGDALFVHTGLTPGSPQAHPTTRTAKPGSGSTPCCGFANTTSRWFGGDLRRAATRRRPRPPRALAPARHRRDGAHAAGLARPRRRPQAATPRRGSWRPRRCDRRR